MRAIRAQSRKPAGVRVSMLFKRRRASSASRTGVLPFLTLYAGPRTEPAGLVGTICPVTNQSNR